MTLFSGHKKPIKGYICPTLTLLFRLLLLLLLLLGLGRSFGWASIRSGGDRAPRWPLYTPLYSLGILGGRPDDPWLFLLLLLAFRASVAAAVIVKGPWSQLYMAAVSVWYFATYLK